MFRQTGQQPLFLFTMAVVQLVSDSLKREINKAIMHTTRGLGRAAKRLLSEREEECRRDGEEGEADGGERRTGMRLTRARAHMEVGLLAPTVVQIEDRMVESQPTATLSPHSALQESPIALPIDSSLEAREAMAIDPTSTTPNTLGVEEVVGQQITQDMAMEAAPQTIEDGADLATIMKDVALLLSSEWRLACLLSLATFATHACYNQYTCFHTFSVKLSVALYSPFHSPFTHPINLKNGNILWFIFESCLLFMCVDNFPQNVF